MARASQTASVTMNATKPSSSTPARAASFRNVRAEDVDYANQATRIIDVREPSEFYGELGHIPTAELVPLDTLERAAHGWSKEVPLVMVCRSGARSAKAAALLVKLGFRDVVNLEGGTQGYVLAGLPVERR
jgi:rhodanese-related sulfurtransferase